MVINLILEDGSNVDDANTYVDVAYARQFAEDVGMELPADDEAVKALLLAGMTYVEGQESRYQGHMSFSDQPLSWPRTNVIVGGYFIPSNEIPTRLKKAQVSAAGLINSGEVLYSTISGQFVIKEKVGPIETEYSDEYLATLTGRPEFAGIDVWLNPLFIQNSGYRLPTFGF